MRRLILRRPELRMTLVQNLDSELAHKPARLALRLLSSVGMKTLSSKTGNTFANIKNMSLLVLATLVAPAAMACRGDIATSSMYYVPHVRDFCSDGKVCSAFQRVVNDAGTGTLGDGRVLRYTGAIQRLPEGCNTAVGSRGNCLIPFISLAGDDDHHRMGSLIRMDSMKGKLITTPDGRKIPHPGYFSIDDVGGGINGSNRFDFFTGSFSPRNKNNVFGRSGQNPTIIDPGVCTASKRFAKVSKDSAEGRRALQSIAEFKQAYNGAPVRQMTMTSSIRPQPNPRYATDGGK